MSVKPIPQLYNLALEQFCRRVEMTFQPGCIILHGSVAQGTDTPASDIDIIVIGNQLPENFFERAFALNRLRDGSAPIEVIGYTPAEWERMMDHLHLTVLEALHWGRPLHGQALFDRWSAQLAEWKSMGLRREETSWSIPLALRHKIS